MSFAELKKTDLSVFGALDIFPGFGLVVSSVVIYDQGWMVLMKGLVRHRLKFLLLFGALFCASVQQWAPHLKTKVTKDNPNLLIESESEESWNPESLSEFDAPLDFALMGGTAFGAEPAKCALLFEHAVALPYFEHVETHPIRGPPVA